MNIPVYADLNSRTFEQGESDIPATRCGAVHSWKAGQRPVRLTPSLLQHGIMDYIDPHIHMISRVTDDYQRMAYAGCRLVTEPAFWAGFDRGTAAGFRDYFRHLVEIEPK